MKTSPIQCVRALVVAAVAFAASAAHAQQSAAASAGDVKIMKLTELNHYEQKAKSIDGKTSQKARAWGVFDVTFATAPEWIDSMTVTYTVMLFNKSADAKKGEKQMTLLQTTVEYADVQQGRDHRAGAVLLPAALLRFGIPMGFAATISVGGQEVASQGVSAGVLQQRKEWWKDPQVLDSPLVERREGYLVDRMDSPFRLVDPDAYELSR